ncbi:hypothetical protein RDI58_009896 [Solanum bulbocastanum]|uniref:Spt4/RpoE2 zinc finger domain-containing protein n=1 Tax=Solanum bulbocastanum TaxID=147425 RepID=A0AAN8TPF0_SOLBU
MGSQPAQIPTSFGHELRACLRCRLVKTYDQFRESGCENCPFFKMDEDHERVVDCTTPNFTGNLGAIVSQFNLCHGSNKELGSSMASNWPFNGSLHKGEANRNMRTNTTIIVCFALYASDCKLMFCVSRYVPGCYTLAVSEALPEDLQNLCEDEHIPYAPPKRI